MNSFRPVVLLTVIATVQSFGVSFLPIMLDVPCGTGINAPIGQLTVQKPFWPITWDIKYLGGDPIDSKLHISISSADGKIFTKTKKPAVFTQQVFKIDGVDLSVSANKVSAYMIIRWPQCGKFKKGMGMEGEMSSFS